MDRNKGPEMNFTNKIVAGIAILLLLCLSLIAISGIYLFGFAGFFTIFSVEFETKSSLIYYIMILIPITLVFELATIMVNTHIGRLLKNTYGILFSTILLKYLFLWIPLYITDELVTGITVPLLTEMVAALLLFIVDGLINGSVKHRC